MRAFFMSPVSSLRDAKVANALACPYRSFSCTMRLKYLRGSHIINSMEASKYTHQSVPFNSFFCPSQ